MATDPEVDIVEDDTIRRRARLVQERLQGADTRLHIEYGLCSKCRHFRIVTKMRGAYAEKFAWCDELPTRFERLNGDNLVKDCAVFWPLGAPTLREMMTEAKLLEGRDLVKGYL